MGTRAPPPTYSVYAQFRYRRLILVRGVPTLARAWARIERLRQAIDEPTRLIIVEDGTGETVEAIDEPARPTRLAMS